MIKKLSMVENAKLVNHIAEHFAASGLTDDAFAAKAREALGFVVNRDHIASRRVQLGLPSNGAPKSTDVSDLLGMIYDLTQKIADVKERVNALESKSTQHHLRAAS